MFYEVKNKGTNVHYVCPAMNVRMRQLNERRI